MNGTQQTRGRRAVTAVTLATVLLATAACGEDAADAPPPAEHTAANGDVFNDADVDFATAMIPHHAEAMAMVDLTVERDLSPEMQQLAETIRQTQSIEIEQMVDWLTAWGEPIPETMRDHVNAGHGHAELEGEMADLDAADDADFEAMWLEMMIEHHEGAIAMAADELEAGTFGPAVDLASAISETQQAEIARMQDLLP